QTGEDRLGKAGGAALNCDANSPLAAERPFREIWVQPASGDSGTALGAALELSARLGRPAAPMRGAALGRSFDDAELLEGLTVAQLPFERPASIAEAAADVLAADGVVAWFQGRSEFGPRALG